MQRNELPPQLRDIIDALERERRDLLTAIEALARIHVARTTNRPVQKRRGRKFMNADERRQVSERMRKYWTARRQGRQDWKEKGSDAIKLIAGVKALSEQAAAATKDAEKREAQNE